MSVQVGRALILVLAVATAGVAAAEVRRVGEGTLRVVCADADGGRHPRRLELGHLLSADLDRGAGAAHVFVDYISDDEESGRAGKITARPTTLSPDGREQALGRFTARVDPESGRASILQPAGLPLGAAAGATWRLGFQRFARLDADECVSIFALLTATP